MDAKQYLEMKKAGNISIHRFTAENARVVCKQFSAVDGQPCKPLIEDYDLVGLRNQLDSLKAQMEGLAEFVKDLEAAEVLVK